MSGFSIKHSFLSPYQSRVFHNLHNAAYYISTKWNRHHICFISSAVFAFFFFFIKEKSYASGRQEGAVETKLLSRVLDNQLEASAAGGAALPVLILEKRRKRML